MSVADRGVDFERLRIAVGSGSAFRPSAAMALFFIGTTGYVVAQPGLLESFDHLWRGLLVAVLLNMTITVIMVAWYVLWFADQPLRPLWLVVPISALIGAGRLELGRELQSAFGLLHHMDVPFAYFAGAIQGLLWLFVMSLFFENRDRFTRERNALLSELATSRMREQRGEVMTNAISQELATQVAQRISGSVSTTRSDLATVLEFDDSATAFRRVASSLREAIDNDIRPMSHALWAREFDSDTQMSARTLLRLTCYQRPFAVAVTTIFTIVFGIPIALSVHPHEQAFLMLVGQTTLGALVARWLDRTLRPGGQSDATTYWLSIVIVALAVTIPSLPLPAIGWALDSAQLWSLSSLISYPMLMVFANIVTGLAGTREAILERAREIVDEATIAGEVRAREMQEASQRLARHLHSSLQGRLMALSLELEQAAERGRASGTADILARLDALLAEPMVQALVVEPVDVEPALRKLIGEWAAVADVRLTYALDKCGPLDQGELIVGIAEEAIANAVRHGHATSITVDVASEGADVLMTIENDGEARSPGEPGVGSRWLDHVSNRHWELGPLPGGGMRLRVRLPDLLPVEHS